MKKIMLVCSAGMSTSMLVNKMEAAAKDRNIEVDIFAVAESEAKNHTNVDVVLLGPQVRFLLSKMTTMMAATNVPVQVIDSIQYGTMNGDAVLTQALSLIKE